MYGLWIIASKKTLAHTRLLYWSGRVFWLWFGLGWVLGQKSLPVSDPCIIACQKLKLILVYCVGGVRSWFFCMERVGLVGRTIWSMWCGEDDDYTHILWSHYDTINWEMKREPWIAFVIKLPMHYLQGECNLISNDVWFGQNLYEIFIFIFFHIFKVFITLETSTTS